MKIRNFNNSAFTIFGGNNVIGGSRRKGNAGIGEGNVVINTGGIWVLGQSASDNIIVGNNIGVDSDGVTPGGNSTAGIHLRYGCTRNVIGIDLPEYRNIASDNADMGITMMKEAYGNLVEGNYVGTDITGTKAIGNYQNGISCEAEGYANIIKNNVVCGGRTNGILLGDSRGNFNVVISNTIGIGADGKTALPNKRDQLYVGDGIYNVIGGSSSNMQNHIFEGRAVFLNRRAYDSIMNGKVSKYADQSTY